MNRASKAAVDEKNRLQEDAINCKSKAWPAVSSSDTVIVEVFSSPSFLPEYFMCSTNLFDPFAGPLFSAPVLITHRWLSITSSCIFPNSLIQCTLSRFRPTLTAKFECILVTLHAYLSSLQINAQWTAKEKPEMNPEKLQKVSTTVVQPHFRVCWLKWSNSSEMSREASHFPPPGFTDPVLESWLPRAAFWAEVSVYPPLLYLFFSHWNTNLRNTNHIVQGLLSSVGRCGVFRSVECT